jgi:alkylation response protein AidB-like acyl-CoA dehydrogenase
MVPEGGTVNSDVAQMPRIRRDRGDALVSTFSVPLQTPEGTPILPPIAMSAENASIASCLDAARSLATLIDAATHRIDAERRLPSEIVAGLTKSGLFRMLVPRSLGGSELPLLAFSEVIEELAMHDGSTAWCVAQDSGVSHLSVFLPPAGAVEVFGPGNSAWAGGHGFGIAVRVDGGYRFSGEWRFGSGIHHSDWVRGIAHLARANGSLILDDAGNRKQLVAFIPTADAEVDDAWEVSGLRGTGSDTYRVRDYFVPDARVLEEERCESGPLYCFTPGHVFAVGFASVALGLARGALDALFDLARKKPAMNQTYLIREQPRIQTAAGRCEANLRAARGFLRDTVTTLWTKAETDGAIGEEDRVVLRLATTLAIERAAEVVDAVYYAAGGSAVFTAAPFERRFRDVHAVTQQSQARLDHYEAVGRYFLGLDPLPGSV